jgi:hypothetical protein
MTNPNESYAKRPILTTQEIDDMIKEADKLPSEYFRLRVKCLIALLKKFGKRRIEISRLKRADLKIVNRDLEVTFNLAKKRKKGLFQYLTATKKLIEKGKADPSLLTKPLPEIEADWREWQKTAEGHNIKNEISLKSIGLEDKYARFIMEYASFMDQHYNQAVYLFPSGMSVFGQSYLIFPNEHLSGRQLLRLIKPLNETAWLHLFRETKGAEIAKEHGRTLTSIYEVKDTLDLEREETAYRYVKRYAAQKQKVET